MTTGPLMMNISAAARYLGVSKGTVRRWSDAGELDYVRSPGGHRRFSQESLDAFVEARRSVRNRTATEAESCG